jgi:hypothetical protein
MTEYGSKENMGYNEVRVYFMKGERRLSTGRREKGYRRK